MKVFVSYSHRDAAYLAADSLLGHLKGLERDGVEFWWDERLVTGEDWDAEIRARIAGTDVALVLVSQSFLDSAYCTDVEIRGFSRTRAIWGSSSSRSSFPPASGSGTSG